MKAFFDWLLGLLRLLFGSMGKVEEKPSPPPEPPPSLPPVSGSEIQGLDVSHYQKGIDWESVHKDGYRFVFIKATEGYTFHDDLFRQFWGQAKAAGLLTSPYHFFHPAKSPETQAANFKSVLSSVGYPAKGDLPIACDIEWTDDLKQLGEEGARNALTFLREMEISIGLTPIVYTNANFFLGMSVATAEEFAKYPLWIAAYVKGSPKIPFPWTSAKFWQFTDEQIIPGFGKIDANKFYGTYEDLLRMAKQ